MLLRELFAIPVRRCAFLLLFAALTAPAQQQPSLADRAAAAKAKPSETQAAGHVVGGDYRNEYLGLEIRRLPGWESIGRGEMNVSEAIGRAALGLKAGVQGDASGRVFGMHDQMGSSVILAIRAIPPEADLADFKPQMQAALKKELPSVRFSNEPVPLGDSAHPALAFRMQYTIEDQPILQSSQAIAVKGYLLVFTITAPPERLSDVLRELQKRIVWKEAQADK
jgi:hypothetical protein